MDKWASCGGQVTGTDVSSSTAQRTTKGIFSGEAGPTILIGGLTCGIRSIVK